MSTARWLVIAMLASVFVVALAMFIDERREFEAAIEMLSQEQEALATAVGDDFESRLARYEETHGSVYSPVPGQFPLAELLGGAVELEQPGSRVLLVAAPDRKGLLTTDARLVPSPELQAAFDGSASRLVLPREIAILFDLPERIVIGAIHRLHGQGGPWAVMVLASGDRLRDREEHAQLRFLLGLGLVTALVLGFGGLALRQQRRQLEVARELAVAALERDRERLLAKADKMATLAALSSGIAHEVATPLGTIMARVEQVLPAVASDPKATGALRVALEQVQRIQTIIQGMLGLVRGDRPSLVQARPESIVRSAAALVRHRFGESGVELLVECAGDLRPVYCDPPMLEQALVNLLLNACDASPRGATVYARVEGAGERLCFIVEDEGDGILEQHALLAQTPFFTTKPRGRGTGLGLAIAHEVVSHHGGKLTLENRTDARGTRAVIELAST